jgi:transcription-repair coupling factor (superfamily II helicase)
MEMAERLLKLAAARELAEGHPFTADSNFHREFADSFAFEETGDQLAAIADIGEDMERTRPMDRLVCGDVGYGKTEVAMRAAFKAVFDGKQVAVLCPTTLLAQQHYQTFVDRFASFPVTVEVVSRFKTRKETADIVKRLSAGEIDILIGTHKLLGKEILFPNLGLVVIDEEQRFGVRHKEQLRSLAKTVDTLTLTATPIPRTLHTAMVGIRELSVIETPPVDRQAVRNFIVKFSDKVVREAITRELDRGGQVFFVHNKVRSLPQMANYVRRMAPQARVVAAHGQMGEKELEEIMLDFVAHRYDVLVTTTIIESGLDIPAANTMLINRADHFGLSQLYQLRGRVGRDRHRAYCYFMIPGLAGVTEVARRRLKAVEELSELGSGFRLAARDMEIRGAGNLLGPEQSGNIDAVGFDTYTEMLEDAVRELKGEPMDDKFEVEMQLAIKGRISPDYVPGLNQRMELYNRLHACRDIDELTALKREMRDRFGPPPEETEKLTVGLQIKLFCRSLKIEKVDMIRERLILHFSPATGLRPDRLVTAGSQRRIQLRFASPTTVEVTVTGEGWRERFGFIRDFLKLLAEAVSR